VKKGDLVRPVGWDPAVRWIDPVETEMGLGVVVSVEISQPSGATTYRVFWTGIDRYMNYWTKDYLEVLND
jgi:hypothetical protein